MRASALEVLVIGCGNIAGGFDAAASPQDLPLTHAGAFSSHPAFRLTACVEPDASRREAFMRRWDVPVGFSSMDEVFAAPVRPDVVSICSPTAAHADHIAAALRLQPRVIFCEKPVTPTAEQTRHWVLACEAAGVQLAVNHTRRWAPDVRRLRDELQGGAWGGLRSIAGLYNKGILNNGSHLVDLVQYLAGPLQMLAAGPAVHDFWPEDPTATALLRTVSGIPVTFATGHAADYAVFELQLVTAQGVLSMEDGGMRWRSRRFAESPRFRGYRALGPAEDLPGSYAQSMTAAIDNLHTAIADGAPLASTGHSALAAQVVCEQIRDAAVATSSRY